MHINGLSSLLNPALIFGESPEFLLYFHKPRAARLVGQLYVSEVSVPRSRPVVRPSDPTRPAGARGFSGDPAARSAPLGARRKLGWNPLAPAGRVGWALLHDGAASGNRHPGSKLDASLASLLASGGATAQPRRHALAWLRRRACGDSTRPSCAVVALECRVERSELSTGISGISRDRPTNRRGKPCKGPEHVGEAAGGAKLCNPWAARSRHPW